VADRNAPDPLAEGTLAREDGCGAVLADTNVHDIVDNLDASTPTTTADCVHPDPQCRTYERLTWTFSARTFHAMSRLVASTVLAVFVSLILAGGLTCDGKSDAPNCCCAQASSPVGSAAAKLCCETVCGKTTSDVPSTPPSSMIATLIPALPVVKLRVEPFDETIATAVPVALKSVEASVAHQDPPELYLQYATFLN
jgi:hypothetical protein